MNVPHLPRLALIPALLLLATSPAPAQDRLAITSVNVVDVASGTLQNHRTVLVEGNWIVAVDDAASAEVPASATVIDGNGRFLIPGLWDMHVHSSSDRLTREVLLPLHVANGVTGVRDMKADCFAPCDELESSIEQVREWRREIAAGTLVGPRIVAGSALINGPRPNEPSSVERPATAEHGRALVRLLEERGVDFIKTYSMLSREAYFALADEARARGMTFAGHRPLAVRTSEASDAGQRSIEHCCEVILDECSERGDELRERVIAESRSERPRLVPIILEMVESFSQERCAALNGRLARNGTWFVPTLRIGARRPFDWRNAPASRYLPAAERDYWAGMEQVMGAIWGGDPQATERLGRMSLELAGAMHAAGVPILAGSDAGTPPSYWGFGLHEELELLVEAGLTEVEALRAATLGPARYLEATDSLGTVETGKLADLVLLDANPLEDVRNTRQVRAVVLNGRYLDREALDALMAAAERAAAATPN